MKKFLVTKLADEEAFDSWRQFDWDLADEIDGLTTEHAVEVACEANGDEPGKHYYAARYKPPDGKIRDPKLVCVEVEIVWQQRAHEVR